MSICIKEVTTREAYPELLKLIHEAFKEHQGNGLNFTCSSYTLDDFEKKVAKGLLLVAYEDDNPIGLTSVSMTDKSKGIAYENITAISPKAKGKGIGTALYEERKNYLIEKGCKYMLSDTAINAASSVKWHIKKCKCSIIGYASFASTNYYSYIFREDLEPVSWYQKHIVYKCQFLISFIKCRLMYLPNGRPSSIFKFYRKLRRTDERINS